VFDLEAFCKLIRLIQGVQEELNCVRYGKSVVLEQLEGGGGSRMYSCLSLVQCDSNDRRLTCVATHQDGKPTDSSEGQAAVIAAGYY